MASHVLLTAVKVICLSVLRSVNGVEALVAVPADIEEQLRNEGNNFDFGKNDSEVAHPSPLMRERPAHEKGVHDVLMPAGFLRRPRGLIRTYFTSLNIPWVS